MTATLDDFISRARAARPDVALDRIKVRTFGASKAMSDRIVPLILSGEKTGTIALAAEFDDEPSRAPQVGDVYVVTWWESEPAVMYRVTEAETLPYERIDDGHVQVEGPNLRTVHAWREIHWPYFGSMMRKRGQEPSPQMPVIFQRFEVIYPPPSRSTAPG